VRGSLDSVLNQLDDRFEVIVVDQNSTDGSRRILERYAQKGAISLYHQKVRNRGLGRQLAFEKSSGDYIIANIDMDDVCAPTLGSYLKMYHELAEGKVLKTLNRSRNF